MAPHKFVIKCGNFAVLVDLHVLPLGAQVDTSWFTTSHIEEVTDLVRGAVDQRVKQYSESLHNRRQHKQKKELPMASSVVVEGKDFNLVANFLKRHISLRCTGHRDLRVFPERYVVCVSCPEDSAARHGNPSRPATDAWEQSRSEYFVGDNQELSDFPTQTKTALQKIAKQACVQREDPRSRLPDQNIDLKEGEDSSRPGEQSPQKEVQHQGPQEPTRTDRSSSPDLDPHSQKVGEDPRPPSAKKKCLGKPSAAIPPRTAGSPTPLPPDRAESKAARGREREETAVEVELLTSGKRTPRLPLASNNTAQTNQNRPAASLRGLSVRLASSGASIGSRSTFEEDGSHNVPRTSRLRRQKRS